ncbi:hypothetical protein [Pseudomonas sp.]|uniref:hypothetical protein n=1 Tax=Pseudomonas sp. TaxID=306 RepID=UPI0028B05B01|nr:hypothetical protein [Pseudomonas sp.]
MTSDALANARHLIGSRYVETVKPYLLELTGLSIAVGPDDLLVTLDIRQDRVFIEVDDQRMITELRIG